MSMSKVDKSCRVGSGQNNKEANVLTWVPEEMWLKIFSFVEQKDLRSISLSNPIFAGYLYNDKVKFLFYHAVPILTSHLDLKELLKCREVCKAWETGVNSCFENATRPLCEEDIRRKSEMEEFNRFCYPLQAFRKVKLEKIIKETVGHRRNPILGRHFHVTTPQLVPVYEDGSLFADVILYAQVELCLQQFGEHIWHLNVRDFNGLVPISLMEYFTQLRKFLLLCPNLKSFGFIVTWIDELNNEGQCQLTNFMDTNTLPAMHSLQIIKTGTNEYESIENNQFVQTGMAKIQDNLMAQYSTQLQSLDLHWLQWKPSYCNGDVLQSLKELRLRQIHSNQSLTDLAQSCTTPPELNFPSLIGLDLEFKFDKINVKGSLMQLVRRVKQASDLRRVGLAISYFYINDSDDDYENDGDYTDSVNETLFSENEYFSLEKKDENLENLEENITKWVDNLWLFVDTEGYISDDDDIIWQPASSLD